MKGRNTISELIKQAVIKRKCLKESLYNEWQYHGKNWKVGNHPNDLDLVQVFKNERWVKPGLERSKTPASITVHFIWYISTYKFR